jgi:hypothetical protein
MPGEFEVTRNYGLMSAVMQHDIHKCNLDPKWQLLDYYAQLSWVLSVALWILIHIITWLVDRSLAVIRSGHPDLQTSNPIRFYQWSTLRPGVQATSERIIGVITRNRRDLNKRSIHWHSTMNTEKDEVILSI